MTILDTCMESFAKARDGSQPCQSPVVRGIRLSNGLSYRGDGHLCLCDLKAVHQRVRNESCLEAQELGASVGPINAIHRLSMPLCIYIYTHMPERPKETAHVNNHNHHEHLTSFSAESFTKLPSP